MGKNFVIRFNLTICFWLVFLSVSAQGVASNQSKYWFYRYRLTNEFSKKCESICGLYSGCSIPAGGAYQCKNEQEDADLLFGDGTSFLGYYIGVLAMEYKLLRTQGAATEQINRTAQELYFAMKAYERVDKNAEKLKTDLKNLNCEDNLNGFFIRDDVETSSLDTVKKVLETPYLSGFKTPERPRRSDEKQVQKIVHSDSRASDDPCRNGKNDRPRYPSQDQISDLFTGFSLVIKSMDGLSNAYYTPPGGQPYYFANNAKYYAGLVMNYLSSNNYKIKVPNSQNADCFAKYGKEETQINSFGIAKAGASVYQGSFGPKSALYVGMPSDDGVFQSTLTALTRTLWQNFLGYPNGNTLWKFNYDNVPYTISTGLPAINIPSFTIPTPTKNIITDPFTIPETISVGDGKDYNNGLLAQFGAVGNSWKVGLEPYVAIDKSITLPWVCSSSWTTCHYECLCCRKWCNVKMEICYPEFAYWNCPQTIPIRVWCYNNPAKFLSTYGANVIADITKNSGLPLGQVTGEALRILRGLVPDVTLCAPTKLPELTYNTTSLTLSEYGNRFKIQPFALLNRYLHDNGNNGIYTYSRDQLKYYMNTAPSTGPHRYPIRDRHNPPKAVVESGIAKGEIDWKKPSEDAGAYGWRVDNRWQKANGDWYDANEGGSGAWPGLDYMFLHNLYYLVHGSSEGFPSFKDKLDVRLDGQNLNMTKTYLGYESITCSNSTVPATGNITLRGGNCVKMTNFSAKSGSRFHAIGNPVFTSAEILDISTNARLESDPNEPKADTVVTQNAAASIQSSLDSYMPAFKEEVRKAVQAYKKYEPRPDYIARKAAVVSARMAGLEVSLSPNPASNSIMLQVGGNLDEQYTWSITNSMGITKLTGQTCCYSFFQNTEMLDISGLYSGVYSLRVNSGGITHSVNFIKQ